jgi:hypothetical protein
MSILSDKQKETILYAQLELAAAIRFAIGLHDSFYVPSALRTLGELSKITGENIAEDLQDVYEIHVD